jgi:hypothetical protein
MRNISLNAEPLMVSVGRKYILIDALYLNEIKSALFSFQEADFTNEIRHKVFPYTDTPFAEFIANDMSFSPSAIKFVKESPTEAYGTTFFSTDTGLIVLVNPAILTAFLRHYSYDDLVDSPVETINVGYWDSIVANFEVEDVGLILSPGITSEIEFRGSGTYEIKI